MRGARCSGTCWLNCTMMDMDLKGRMQSTLAETVAAYTSTNRAVSSYEGEDNICMYQTNDGRRCAVGRMLTPAGLACVVPGGVNEAAVRDSLLLEDPLFVKGPMFKEEYQGLPLDFVNDLQELHDTDANWDETGLTDAGKSHLHNIKLTYDL